MVSHEDGLSQWNIPLPPFARGRIRGEKNNFLIVK